jgi:hypothetical protein
MEALEKQISKIKGPTHRLTCEKDRLRKMMLIPDIDPHGDSSLHYDGDFTYKDCSSGCIDTLIRGREYVAYVNQTNGTTVGLRLSWIGYLKSAPVAEDCEVFIPTNRPSILIPSGILRGYRVNCPHLRASPAFLKWSVGFLPNSGLRVLPNLPQLSQAAIHTAYKHKNNKYINNKQTQWRCTCRAGNSSSRSWRGFTSSNPDRVFISFVTNLLKTRIFQEFATIFGFRNVSVWQRSGYQ